MPDLIPLDAATPLIEKSSLAGTVYFRQRWSELQGRGQVAPYRTGTVFAAPDQTAAIGAVPIVDLSLPAGNYEVRWNVHVITADGVSSSVGVTIAWTQSGRSLSLSGSAVTGDTNTSVQSGSVPFIVSDGGPITIATSYASNTPGAMHYELYAELLTLP